jgi:hypothetical protein
LLPADGGYKKKPTEGGEMSKMTGAGGKIDGAKLQAAQEKEKEGKEKKIRREKKAGEKVEA